MDAQSGEMPCVDAADPEPDWACEPAFELGPPEPFASAAKARAWLWCLGERSKGLLVWQGFVPVPRWYRSLQVTLAQ